MSDFNLFEFIGKQLRQSDIEPLRMVSLNEAIGEIDTSFLDFIEASPPKIEDFQVSYGTCEDRPDVLATYEDGKHTKLDRKLPAASEFQDMVLALETHEELTINWEGPPADRMTWYEGVRIVSNGPTWEQYPDRYITYDLVVYEGRGNYDGGSWVENKCDLNQAVGLYVKIFGLKGHRH